MLKVIWKLVTVINENVYALQKLYTLAQGPSGQHRRQAFEPVRLSK